MGACVYNEVHNILKCALGTKMCGLGIKFCALGPILVIVFSTFRYALMLWVLVFYVISKYKFALKRYGGLCL